MVTTRSMSRIPDAETAELRRQARARVQARAEVLQRRRLGRARVQEARKSYPNIKELLFGDGPVIYARIVSAPKQPGKYYDLDEKLLALGIFIVAVKEERLKNDPDFAFTMDFYRTTMHEFDSLSDDDKAVYIAEAEKKNTMEEKAATKWEFFRAVDRVIENDKLEGKACCLYYDAVRAEHWKNTGKSDGADNAQLTSYFIALKTAKNKRPYLAEATVRQVEERASLVEGYMRDKYGY